MVHRAWNRCAILVAVLGALPAFAAGGEPRPRSVLAGVVALEKRITYSEPKIPLSDLLQKVAADTGVALTAAKAVADEPVAVVVKEMPARELLEQLADLLDYQWSRREVGQAVSPPVGGNRQANSLPHYEIWQDVASKQREEALRRGVFADVEKRFREEVGMAVAMAALPSEEIQAIVTAAEQRRAALKKFPPEERRAWQDSPEGQAQERRASLGQRLAAPIPRALAGLIGRLTPREWEWLQQGQELVFSSDPDPGEARLPDMTLQLFRAATPRSDWIRLDDPEFGDPASVEREREREKVMQAEWSGARAYRVVVRLETNAVRTSADCNLVASAQPIRGDASAQPNAMRYGEQKNLFLSAAARLWLPERSPEETRQRRAALGEDPVVGLRRRLIAQMKSRRMSPEAGGGPVWELGDLLPDLARTYDVDFISDAYWNTSIVGAELALPSADTPLFELLDRFWWQEHVWDREGRLIRIRSRTWFFDRSHEIPLRLVRRWKKLWDAHGALPLDEYTTMANTLSEDQLLGIFFVNQAMPLSRDIYALHDAWHGLRLYAALSIPQRQVLWQGRALPVARMTPEQRQRFAAFYRYDNLRHRYRATLPKPAELAAGGFRLTAKPSVRIRKEQAGQVSYDEPSAPPPQGSAKVKTTDNRVPVLELTFHYLYGRQSRDSVQIAVASLP